MEKISITDKQTGNNKEYKIADWIESAKKSKKNCEVLIDIVCILGKQNSEEIAALKSADKQLHKLYNKLQTILNNHLKSKS